MQVGSEKIAILDEYLAFASIIHCWTVACYQHFDGLV